MLVEPAGARSMAAPQASDPGQTVDRVRAALAASSVSTVSELQSAIGLSRLEVHNATQELLRQGDALVAAGPEPAFVAPRELPSEISTTGTIPVFDVDAQGRPQEFGTLVPTTHGRYWMEERSGVNHLHDGMPWFLQDMRPQGFLGRAFALANPQLALPTHPQQWTDEQILRVLVTTGEDLPGSLIVGEKSFERFLARRQPERVDETGYPELARASMQGAPPGSSAGGEQPKFCCVRSDGVHVLVKFSPPMTSDVGRRWGDLLVCEHLALRSLQDAGVPAARSRIIEAGGRIFLEVERFDRTERGRIGMVSLLAYDCEYVGQLDNWAATAERMQRKALLTGEHAQRLRFLEAFGLLIANTDRHYGNVSLVIDAAGDWALAPAYDQLPMFYAPVASELLERPAPQPVLPSAQMLPVWEEAAHAAHAFWKAVSADPLISPPFRAIAGLHRQVLDRHLEDSAQLKEPARQDRLKAA